MKDLPFDDWIALKDFCEEESDLSPESKMRWLLQHFKENNSCSFVRRMGKTKMLISPTLFFKWLEKNERK